MLLLIQFLELQIVRILDLRVSLHFSSIFFKQQLQFNPYLDCLARMDKLSLIFDNVIILEGFDFISSSANLENYVKLGLAILC